MCGIDYNRFPDAFDELPCDYAVALGALLRWEDAPRKVLRYLEHFEGLKEQDWILGKELRKLRGAELRRPLSSRSCPGMADTSKCNDPDRKVTCTLCPKWIGD